MAEQIRDQVEHGFFRREVNQPSSNGEEGGKMSFMFAIDNTSASGEQFRRILDILNRAAAEASAVMGW